MTRGRQMLSSKRQRYGKGCNSDAGENHHEVDDDWHGDEPEHDDVREDDDDGDDDDDVLRGQ